MKYMKWYSHMPSKKMRRLLGSRSDLRRVRLRLCTTTANTSSDERIARLRQNGRLRRAWERGLGRRRLISPPQAHRRVVIGQTRARLSRHTIAAAHMTIASRAVTTTTTAATVQRRLAELGVLLGHWCGSWARRGSMLLPRWWWALLVLIFDVAGRQERCTTVVDLIDRVAVFLAAYKNHD